MIKGFKELLYYFLLALIARKITSALIPLKGALLWNNSNNKIPSAQTSVFLVYLFFINISGAIYSNVPQTVSLISLSL